MAARITKSTEYIRHTFTPEERLKMGSELAEAHNRTADIDADEAVVKSQFKERRATVEQTIGRASRDLANGFTMINVECRLEWDKPNVNEVSYIRIDTGEVIKTRPFTESERQQDLPLAGEVVFVPAEESEANIAKHFGSVDGTIAIDAAGPEDAGNSAQVDAAEERTSKKDKEAKVVRAATIKLSKL
jgi:hypothetical protein